MKLSGARLIDYSGLHKEFEHFHAFSEEVAKGFQNRADNKTVVVIDEGHFLLVDAPHLVRDHLNLTGWNPLIGHDYPGQEQFDALADVYITEYGGTLLAGMPVGIAAGLKPGCVPAAAQKEFLKEMGANFYCYHLIPTMIVAAHAGYRVLGLVLPKGQQLSGEILTELTGSGL